MNEKNAKLKQNLLLSALIIVATAVFCALIILLPNTLSVTLFGKVIERSKLVTTILPYLASVLSAVMLRIGESKKAWIFFYLLSVLLLIAQIFLI